MKRVDGRADGRRLDGYAKCSPCEPKCSGELKLFTSAAEIDQVLTGCGMPRLKISDSFAKVRNAALQFLSLRSYSHLIAPYR